MADEFRLAYAGPIDAVSPWLLRGIGQSAGLFAAVCCDSAAQAERAAGDFHARWPFHGVRTMLQECQPHGVIAAGSLARRAEIVRLCAASRVPVLSVGLPLAPAARGGGRPDAFVWNAAAGRFSPAGVMAKRLLESGKVGEPISISIGVTRCRAARDAEESAWPVTRDTLFEAADWAVALAGPIREVFARGHPDGAIAATVVGATDVPMSLRVHEHGGPDQAGVTLEIRGSDGALLTLDRHMRLKLRSGTRVLASHAPSPGVSDPAVECGYVGLVNEFVRKIADGRGGASDGSTAATLTETILSALSRSGAVKSAGKEPAKTARKV